MATRRQVVSSTGPREPAASQVVKRLKEFPNTIGHCTDTSYANGEPRAPGWFTVSAKLGLWNIVYKDPDAGASLRVQGPTLDDALELGEIMLGDPQTPWEVDQYLVRTARKRKK